MIKPTAGAAKAATALGAFADAAPYIRGGAKESYPSPAAGPQRYVARAQRPLLATDRSESSSSEHSTPSPGDPPSVLPPVAVPFGPLPLQPRINGSSGSATASGGASGSGSGGGGGGDSMRSNASSQESSQLLGIALISNVPSEDSFDLSPESSPRRRRSPAPGGLEPVKETPSPPEGGIRRPSAQEEMHPEPSPFEETAAVAVAAAVETEVAVNEEAQAKADSELTPVAVALGMDPLAYSPVREPPASPPAAYSPLVVISTSPGDIGAAKISDLSSAGGVSTTPGISPPRRPVPMRWESTSDAGSGFLGGSPRGDSGAIEVLSQGAAVHSGGNSSITVDAAASDVAVFGRQEALEGPEETAAAPAPSPLSEPSLLEPRRQRSSESKRLAFRLGSRGSSGRGSSVWDTEEDDQSMQDDFSPRSATPRSDRTGRRESTLAENSSSASHVAESSESASQSASSAIASATAAMSAATLAASAARAAADQARPGIWSTQPQARFGTPQRQPRSAMARSAAAAGAAAAAVAAAPSASSMTESSSTSSTPGDGDSGPSVVGRRAEAKSSLRVRDPGLLRIASSQSTEAPSSKSFSIMAPSPDGGGAYLFSRGESRAFGVRRQDSSLSSYPSFGLSSSGVDSSNDQLGQGSGTGDAGGLFFAEDAGRRAATPDDKSDETWFEDKSSASTGVPVMPGNVTISDGGSLAKDANDPRVTGAPTGGGAVYQQAKFEREAAEVSALAQQPVILAPSTTGRAPRTPSAAPGGGTLFTLVPAQVEHQRRARASRSAAGGIGGLGSSSRRMRKQSTSKDMGSAEDEDSDSSEVPQMRTARENSASKSASRSVASSSTSRSTTTSTFRRVASAMASVAKAATGYGSGSGATGVAERATTTESAAGTGGAKRPRFSGEVETTGQPEAKKMMAQTSEVSFTAGEPQVSRSESARTSSSRSAKESGSSRSGSSGKSESSYESVDSTSAVRNPPFLHRLMVSREEDKGYASPSSED